MCESKKTIISEVAFSKPIRRPGWEPTLSGVLRIRTLGFPRKYLSNGFPRCSVDRGECAIRTAGSGRGLSRPAGMGWGGGGGGGVSEPLDSEWNGRRTKHFTSTLKLYNQVPVLYIIGGSCYKYLFCRDKWFVATNMCLLSRQRYACRDKNILSRQNLIATNNKRNFVATKRLSRQAYFITIKGVLSRHTRVCRDKKDICDSARQ